MCARCRPPMAPACCGWAPGRAVPPALWGRALLYFLIFSLLCHPCPRISAKKPIQWPACEHPRPVPHCHHWPVPPTALCGHHLLQALSVHSHEPRTAPYALHPALLPQEHPTSLHHCPRAVLCPPCPRRCPKAEPVVCSLWQEWGDRSRVSCLPTSTLPPRLLPVGPLPHRGVTPAPASRTCSWNRRLGRDSWGDAVCVGLGAPVLGLGHLLGCCGH